MKQILLMFVFFIANSFASDFDKYFESKSIRVDLFQSGNANEERITLKEMWEEKYFSANKSNLIDELNLGYYYTKIFSESGKLIYSRGFSTIFQEWQSTKESEIVDKSFPISVRIPFPKGNVKFVIEKRDRKNNFKEIFSMPINPKDYFIKKDFQTQSEILKLHYSGNYENKVDILFIPDGYTEEESEKMVNDFERFSKFLIGYEPFKSNSSSINIWGLKLFSNESGTDIPGNGIYKNTALESNFYTFDSERYLTVFDNHNLAKYSSVVPYDYIIVLVNTEKYGGGGIYNFWAVTCVDNPKSELVLVHEFGHAFAGLADEYYTSDVSYEDYFDLSVEPWEKNITTLVNFESKWKNMLEANTPIPTLANQSKDYPIGVYEGGGYVAKGVYRPSENSIMKSLGEEGFNEVSKSIINLVINHFSK